MNYFSRISLMPLKENSKYTNISLDPEYKNLNKLYARFYDKGIELKELLIKGKINE